MSATTSSYNTNLIVNTANPVVIKTDDLNQGMLPE